MRALFTLISIALLFVLPTMAYCGDDDKAPAYRIYIDPETGAYTTDDPQDAVSAVVAESIVAPATKKRDSISWRLIAGVMITLLIALLLTGTIVHKRRHLYPR